MVSCAVCLVVVLEVEAQSQGIRTFVGVKCWVVVRFAVQRVFCPELRVALCCVCIGSGGKHKANILRRVALHVSLYVMQQRSFGAVIRLVRFDVSDLGW